jgi:methyl-accepting chemotaxis protein
MYLDTPANLYERLGGKVAIDEAMGIFQRSVQADETLAPFFPRSTRQQPQAQLKAFVQIACEIPGELTQSMLVKTCAPLVKKGFTEVHFVQCVQYLARALTRIGATPDVMAEAIARVARIKDTILGPLNDIPQTPSHSSNDTEFTNTIDMPRNYYQEKGNGAAMAGASPDAAAERAEFQNRIAELEQANLELKSQAEAIDRSQAVIEFALDGTILVANPNFLNAVGYTLDEVKGKHHSIFVDADFAKGNVYRDFWARLNRGEYISGEFRRRGRYDREVWLQASYNPIFDINGKPLKIVKYASDITQQKIQSIDTQGQLDAVNRSNAVVEFDLDGTIRHANENFLRVVGYTLSEVKGKHHRMFVDSGYSNSREYADFWARLNRGEFLVDNFMRVSKSGRPVYIQASYNPILDAEGKPYKVVKYATDMTEFTVALKAVSDFAGHLRKGDFDARLDIQASGDVGRLIEDNLALRDTLREIVSKVNEVVKAAGQDGNLQARINIKDAAGTWRQLTDSINALLQSIAEPMLEFNQIIMQMSNGDLTNKFGMAASGDIKNMGQSLNKAIDNLNDLLYNIGRNADVVASSSMNMLQRTEGMKRNTNEVATAIAQMAKGAQDQAQRTDESSKLVDKVMVTSSEMEKRAHSINKAAEKGQKSSENGLKIMKTLVTNMTGIKESAEQTSKSIDILTQRAEEIGRTLNVITDIASQTNLLALNAAIEAARAGDAGRGFAVVAEEIRKLAEGSRKSAVEIEKIIGDVQKDTQAATKAIDAMQSSVKDGNKATNEAEEIFQEIADSSEETFTYSKEIQEATSGQKSSVDVVMKNIEQIVVVAEETAAGTQQAASSSQQMAMAMGEISEGSNKLSGVAAELQTGVNKFKLRKAS